MRHINALDGLRGIAAYSVVLAHYSNHFSVYRSFLGGGVGQIGVMVFFVLSGFLMAHLCFKKEISFAKVGEFYWRRVTRVYPLFLVVVLTFFAIYMLFNGSPLRNQVLIYNMTPEMMLQHLTLQRGVGPMWTIPVEIIFYFFVPIFWLIFRKAGVTGLVLACGAIFVTQYMLGFRNMFMSMNEASLTSTVHFFLFGFITWFLADNTSVGTESGRKERYIKDFGFVLLILAFVPMFPNVLKSWSGVQTALWKDLLYFIYIPALVYFTAVSDVARLILGSSFLSFFGKISYSVYLWHIPILVYVNRHLDFVTDPFLRLVVCLLIATAVGYLSYLLIEKPTRGFLNNLLKKRGIEGAARAT